MAASLSKSTKLPKSAYVLYCIWQVFKASPNNNYTYTEYQIQESSIPYVTVLRQTSFIQFKKKYKHSWKIGNE